MGEGELVSTRSHSGRHRGRREQGVKRQVAVFFDVFGPSRGCWRKVWAQGAPAVERWEVAEAFLRWPSRERAATGQKDRV